jgi:lipid-A-disaccharide synthase
MTGSSPVSKPLRLFILAGEPSGDRIAADLVRRLQSRIPLAFSGVGGDELIGLGLKPLFPMSDLSVMGVTDVLRRLPLLLRRLGQTARTILSATPDVVVLVDSQDFSRLLAKRLRRGGYKGRILLYVAPSVWARAPERAARIRPLFDEVLAVLPFEPDVMSRLDGPPTSYVGHPALAEVAAAAPDHAAGPVLLLPGSRAGELRRHLPLFRAVAESLNDHPAVTGFVLPTLPALAEQLRGEVSQWQAHVELVADRDMRAKLYPQAIAALAVSGTVTLELALAKVPMVVAYALDGHQARIYSRLGQPQVSLPNIVLGRKLVPEMVSRHLAVPALGSALTSLLENQQARRDQILAFGELVNRMQEGDPSHPRQDPADRVLHHWQSLNES